MTPNFTVDMREFNAALAARAQDTKRTLPELVNQTAFNVAARAMRGTKQASGPQVREYLTRPMQAYRRADGSRFANMPRGRQTGAADWLKQGANSTERQRRKNRVRSLRLVVLIAQAKFFKKHGYGIGKGKSNKRTKRLRLNTAQQSSIFTKSGRLKKRDDVGHLSLAAKAGKMVMGSDYGDAMKKYAGKILNKAVRSVGYLSAMWVPVLRSLGPLVKFKGLAKGLRYGVLWRTSSSVGTAVPAREGANVAAVLDVTAGNPRMTANAQAVARAALQGAVDAEAVEMRRHLEAKVKG